MSAFYHIRLELAREPGHPHGDPRAGWDLVAALDEDGRLDLAACRAEPDRCRIRRFIRDATMATGRLRHTVGDRWVFDLEPDDALDEAGFRLGSERFVLGEYVSIVAPDGVSHTYRVERVEDLTEEAAVDRVER
ncbi:hypothetical protein BH10PSE1_BH10PSE1_35570 [soil metagenome]